MIVSPGVPRHHRLDLVARDYRKGEEDIAAHTGNEQLTRLSAPSRGAVLERRRVTSSAASDVAPITYGGKGCSRIPRSLSNRTGIVAAPLGTVAGVYTSVG